MKKRKALLLLLLASSCGTNPVKTATSQPDLTIPKDWKQKTIVLVDHLATITLYLPSQYDTTISWYDPGDCIDCPGGGTYHYRVQSKFFPVITETGWQAPADSSIEFHVLHRQYAIDTGIVTDTVLFLKHEGIIISDKSSPDDYYWESINGRRFIIHKKENDDVVFRPPQKGFRAATIFNDRLLFFFFKRRCNKQYEGDYEEDCHRILRTIKIE